MKLITLNVWGGRVRDPLFRFFDDRSEEIDIFCFQEVHSNASDKTQAEDGKENCSLELFNDIDNILNNHKGFFRPCIEDWYGIALWVKKDFIVEEEGDIFIHRERGSYKDGDGGHHPRNLQYAILNKDGEKFIVVNVHGLWNGKGKDDSEDRINQSNKIRNFLGRFDMPKVLVGDFNLKPETESLSLIKEGMIDLVEEYGIKDTRTSYYEKEIRFADYIFTKGVEVKDFKVLPDEVSDHAALYLEFEL
ncbi:MAG: exonuclease III [Candidatus Paceibacteria bacterium]|jgi:exonuclease III